MKWRLNEPLPRDHQSFDLISGYPGIYPFCSFKNWWVRGRRQQVKPAPRVNSFLYSTQLTNVTAVRMKKLIKQRKAIDCFACHHCHFKSRRGFDESQSATRWRTLFLFTTLIFHVLASVTASPVLSLTRPTQSLFPYQSSVALLALDSVFCRAAVVLSSEHSGPH